MTLREAREGRIPRRFSTCAQFYATITEGHVLMSFHPAIPPSPFPHLTRQS